MANSVASCYGHSVEVQHGDHHQEARSGLSLLSHPPPDLEGRISRKWSCQLNCRSPGAIAASASPSSARTVGKFSRAGTCGRSRASGS